jgi:hypothetical protein
LQTAPIAHGPSRPSVVFGGTDAVFEVVADDEVERLVVEFVVTRERFVDLVFCAVDGITLSCCAGRRVISARRRSRTSPLVRLGPLPAATSMVRCGAFPRQTHRIAGSKELVCGY